MCENVSIVGVDRQGIFADYAVIPAENAWKTDRRFPPEADERFYSHTALHIQMTKSETSRSHSGAIAWIASPA